MPTYRRRRIIEPQTAPPLGPLRGHQLMRRARASAIHATGDRVLSHGRRILATCGLHGASGWHVADTAPGQMSLTYPKPNQERGVMLTPAIRLTPGHFVRAVVVAGPSGMTEETGSVPTGAKGEIHIGATYTNGDGSTTVVKVLAIPGSGELYAAQPSGASAAWSQLHKRRSALMLPADMNLIANLAAWADDVTVSIAVAYVGSPRVVDLVVYEEPLALAYDLAAGDWIAPMHAAPDGGSLGQLGGPVPVIKRSASDPGGGVEILTDAAARLAQETGPVLWSATTWDEGGQDFTAAEAEYLQVTGTTYTEIMSGEADTYSAATPAWSMSSGANARRVQESEQTAIMRDNDNVVPVRCYIYGAMSTAVGSPTATVRFEAASYSIAEVAVPAGTSYAWHSAPGTLRCGLGAQDPTALQVRAKTSSGGASFRWRYAMVVFEDQ